MLPSESLSIAELVIYPPILIANIFVLIRHGFSRQSGWIFLASFCIIRITGASFGVAYANTHNINDLEWSAILGSVGISALLLSTAGILQRVTDSSCTRMPKNAEGSGNKFEKIILGIPVIGILYKILYASRATALSRRSRLIQVTYIPSLVALIICIVGGTDQTSSKVSDQAQGKSMLKAGIIIFVIIYIVLCAVAICTALDFDKISPNEKRILAAVLLALPLIAPRLVWSLLAYFSHISTFNTFNGDIVVRAFMSILEEFLIIILYTVVGLMVPPAYQAESDATSTKQYQDASQDVELEAQNRSKHEPQNSSRLGALSLALHFVG